MRASGGLTVVFAPDAFKGSIPADRAAAALAAGWLSARPGDTAVLRPMADGGEGTLDAVAAAVPGAERVPIEVLGPAGRAVRSSWLRLPDGAAVVELAAVSGLLLLERDPRSGEVQLRPREAHTFGVGQAVRAAVAAGARRVLVGLGGSASSDGGAGMLAALGAELYDDAGARIPLGNAGLARLAAVDLGGVVVPPEGIVAWTDVRSPLLGREGAVAVFGPQKGLRAGSPEAADVEAALARFAAVAGGDAALPGAGAAGGTGYGLALIGADLRSGAAAVAELIGLGAALDSADLVITGEGRFDAQSAQGKVVSQVHALAAARGVPVALAAGALAAPADGFAAALALSDLADPGGRDPMRDAAPLLREVGAELAARLAAPAASPPAAPPAAPER